VRQDVADVLLYRKVMEQQRVPSLAQIAFGFAELGLRSFGGVAAQVRDVLVRGRRWVDEGEFAEVLGVGQVLPGGNVLNVAAMLGDRWRGPLGALVAISALTVPSTFVAIAFLSVANAFVAYPIAASIERMIVAAAAGGIVATGLRLLAREIKRR
jgi:chromate transporter